MSLCRSITAFARKTFNIFHYNLFVEEFIIEEFHKIFLLDPYK